MRAINLIISVCCLVLTVEANFPPYFYTPTLKQLQPIDLFGNVPPIHPYIHYQEQQLPSSYELGDTNVQSTPPDSSPTVPNKYRGFGYHTNYDGGASATVVFFTGGSPQNSPALFFPNRITVASDNLDPQQFGNVQETIEKALNERKVGLVASHQQNTFFGMTPFVQSFLQNPFEQTGLVYFYQGEGLPASTSLLAPAISSLQNQNQESVTQSTVINNNLEDDTLSVDAAATRNLPANNHNNETSSTTNVESTSAEVSTNDPFEKQFVNINNDTTSSTNNIMETSTTAPSTNNTNSTEDPETTTNVLTLDQSSTMTTNENTTVENSNVTNSS